MDHKETYSSQAETYEQLVSHEDYQGNILRALNQIRPLRGLDVLDLGAGTGRLACLVASVAGSIIALDASTHMLQTARAKLKRSGSINWLVASGDHRWLPLKDESAGEKLVPYYSFLEASGFSPTWIRTDFKFESLDQAASLTRFFFGDEFAQQVIANNWIILPECTGLWWINV